MFWRVREMKQFLYFLVALLAFGALFGLALVPVGMSLAVSVAKACAVGLALLALLPGKAARLLFVTICAWVVTRYIGWRFMSLPLDGGFAASVCAVLLLLAECYGAAMLLLGLFVNVWPLERAPRKLPTDMSRWPTVDVYIPTYSEPLSVVGPTLMAAMEIDYPRNKLRVYVLDDGFPRSQNPNTDPETARDLALRTEGLKALCARHGATWLTREKNEHAKSGNMNAAMRQTQGELILVLDADHVPTRDILKNTAGFFPYDRRLAFVQTPHFFLNADPVEKNLQLLNRMPGENDMFYRVVQKGLDLWNTSFFCGSAALIRREAVEDVGGFSVDSITEDASTSVKMHQRGWRSAYLGIPMVAGLQPETFAGFTVQRLRWAMGMVQIMLKQNPLLIRGLAIPQRLSYLSIVMFWLFPLARVAFFSAPFMSLFFNMTIYPVGIEFFWAYTVPYLVAVLVSFDKTFGRVRRIMISELYETLQAFYALPAILSTIVNPNAPTFKVTPKGEHLDEEFISNLNLPFYVFYGLTILGLAWGGLRMVMEPESRSALLLSVSWLGFNWVLLSGALGCLVERAQKRSRPRVPMADRCTLTGADGEPRPGMLVDGNEKGVRLRLFDGRQVEAGWLEVDDIRLPVKPLPGRVVPPGEDHPMLFACETAEQERAAVMLCYGRSNRWMRIWTSRESSSNLLLSALGVIRIALKGGHYHLSKLLQSSK